MVVVRNWSAAAIVVVLVVVFQPFGLSSSRRTAVSLPVVFETNMGQAPTAYRFVSRHGNVETLFSSSGVDLVLPQGKLGRTQIGFRLLGAERNVLPEGHDLLPSVSHYLLGNDPSRWLHGVPNHSKVVYPQIYPGIDLVFHGSGDNLEHDFKVSPGADPKRPRFSIIGAKTVSLAASGDLDVSLSSGTLEFQKPFAYQDVAGRRETVECSFILDSDRTVRFELGPYDRHRELVIDPVFSFSTYLAGSTADNTAAITTDSSGNVYVTGYTYSSDFPVMGHLENTYNGSPDAFVSKLDPTGKSLLYSTYLGGSSRNYGNAVAVDSKGNIIVAGTSSSNDFPHEGAVPALTCEGNNDCFFLASIKPNGSAFNYVGLIGGIEGTTVATGESGSGILVIDTAGNAYLASVTDDAHFEITPGTLSTSVPGYPYNSTFVLKADKTGALVYSTIVPGTAPESLTINLNDVFVPAGISVDSKGQVTIAGTSGPGLPSTSGVIQPTFPNNLSAENASAGFVLQLDAKASAINYATYVPGTDSIGGLATNSTGDNYLTGGTSETNLPVSSNAYQKTIKSITGCPCTSGFVLELDGEGKNVLGATYLEGLLDYEATTFSGIALDSNSNVYLGGWTGSAGFPLQNPFTSIWEYSETNSEMVLAEMSPDLSALLFGSFLSSTDQVYAGSTFSALAVDSQDNLIVTGETSAMDFPTTPGAFQPIPPTQARHPFITKFDMAIPAASVCLDTWSLNFGLVPAKKSSTQTVHLTNCGNSPLNLTSLVSSVPMVKAAETCGAIQPGSVCPIAVTFSPVDSSTVGGTVSLNDNAVLSPQVFSIYGQGSAPQLSPSSGSFDFGHLLVNTASAVNSLLFSNGGNAILRISSVSVDGDFSITQNSCKGMLQPSEFCVVDVAFSPTVAGIRTGTLSIASNDPVYPKAGISLEGYGDTVYAVPVIAWLNLPAVQIKNGTTTLEVTGANFYPASVIEINGKPQATTFSSEQQLEATMDSDLTDAIGEVSVTVFNPTPGGGGSVAVPLTRYQVVNVDAAFLTAVPGSSFIYASVPSGAPTNPNTVIPINPVSGALGKPIPVGQNPGVMAASSDGSYLFVVANQDQTVQRINLATHAVDRTFPFPPNGTTCCGALSGVDLNGVPGVPQEVVLAVQIPLYGFGEMALYNDSGLVNYVPTTSVESVNFSSFAYVDNPQTIYALPFTNAQNSFFNIVTINSEGLQFTPYQGGNYAGNNTTGAQVVSDGTLLYTSSGEVWNPVSQAQVGSFPVTTYDDTSYPNLYNLIMDLPSGHIFLVGLQPYEVDSASVVLSAYSQHTLALSGALALPQLSAGVTNSLVRWGSDGFAFLAQGSTPYVQAVYLLTSSLAKPLTANAVPVLKTIVPSSASVGSQGIYLTLNGQKFAEGAIVNWNGAPLQTTYVTSTILTALVPSTDLTSSGTVLITVTSPPPGGGTTHSVKFTISQLTPLVSFSSSDVSFPAQAVGTASKAAVVAVQNPGTASLTISGVTITGTNAGSFHETNNCGSSLAPGANCSISVVFDPASTGPLAASVNVADNVIGSPQAVSLTGTGK
jgi:hypothetical protein